MRPIGWMVMAGRHMSPSVMVTLILYSGSREGCGPRGRSSVIVVSVSPIGVITGNLVPDHVTVARFICRHERALAGSV